MPPEFDPFEEGDSAPSSWLNANAPPRARQADDDIYLMDHEPTPEPEAQPDLIQSVERSFCSVSSSAETQRKSPFSATRSVPSFAVPSLPVRNFTIKEEEESDDLYSAGSPIQRTRNGPMNGIRQPAALCPAIQ